LPMPHAGKDVGTILLDFLPAAAAIAKLAAVKLEIDGRYVDRQPRRQPGKEGQKRLTVRFTRRIETKHSAESLNK
jgi:hypothetical protein